MVNDKTKDIENWYIKNKMYPTPVSEWGRETLKLISRKDETLSQTIDRALKKYRERYDQLVEDFIKNQGYSREVAEFQAKKIMEEV